MIARSQRDWTPFKPGQLVWLEAKNLKLPYLTKKIAPKRHGPFEVLEEIGSRAYRIKLPPQWRIHNVFHASLLSPYKETETHGPAFALTPPDTIEGEEEYEVENIVGHRRRGRGYQFLVHWKGYPTSEDEWLPPRNLENSPELVEAYKRTHGLTF